MAEYDVVVIGAGPGGYEAALFAAEKGMKTAVVDKGTIGGTCLHSGCIPTKTLLHTAEVYHEMERGEAIGLVSEKLSIDYAKLQEYKNQVVETLSGGIWQAFKKQKVDCYVGTGRLMKDKTVEVTLSDPGEDGESRLFLKGKHVLLAAGSEPVRLPVAGADFPGVMDSTELLNLDHGLESLTIVGGGVIGMEFASLYAALGTRVTVIEAMERVLPTMDKEFGQSLKMSLKKQGVEIHTESRLLEIRKEEGLTCVFTEKEEEKTVSSEAVLIAIGRRACSAGLFEEGVEIGLNRGQVLVNEHYETQIPGVYAIGDLIGGIQLAHVATAEGLCAVSHMLGETCGIDMSVVPSCVYTSPEIASCGLSLEEARERGIEAEQYKYVMGANGKTVLTRQERSFIRVTAEKGTGRLLGAQLICARATDMIGEFVSAVVNGLTKEQLARAIRPHPTFNEAVWELMRS